MKTLKLTIFGIFLLITNAMQGQVSVNINIGSPPEWGPVGYTEMEYYYLPDIEAYYDIRATQFIYFGAGKWIRSSRLPRQYRNYDLYSGYKVVLNDYHGRSPYKYFDRHKVKYYKGYHGAPQQCYKPKKGKGHYKKNKHNHYDDDDRDYDNRNHRSHYGAYNSGRR